MLRRARFTNAIASTEGWSYPSGAEVTLGERFSRESVPARIAEPWLASGLLEPIAPHTAAPVPAPNSATTPRRNPSRR